MPKHSFNVWICPSLPFFLFLSLLMSFILSNTLGAILSFFFFFSSVSNKSRSGVLSALVNLISLLCVFFVRLSLRLSSASLSIVSSFPRWQKKSLGAGSNFSVDWSVSLSSTRTYVRWFAGDCVSLVLSGLLVWFRFVYLFPFLLHWLPCMAESEPIWLEPKETTNICIIN